MVSLNNKHHILQHSFTKEKYFLFLLEILIFQYLLLISNGLRNLSIESLEEHSSGSSFLRCNSNIFFRKFQTLNVYIF